MHEPTAPYFHPDGTVSRVCTHESSWMNANGHLVCDDCGAATERPATTDHESWEVPAIGTRVRIVSDLTHPHYLGRVGTVRHTLSGSTASFWVDLDDGTPVYVIRKVTSVEAVRA